MSDSTQHLTPDANLALSGNTYHSPPARPGLLSRLLPSPVFYLRFVRQVFWSSNLAKKGRYTDLEWFQSSFNVLRALESVGAQIEITGLDSLRRLDRPCVFVANHMSTLETVILPGIIQPYRDCTFIVKRGIVEYPVFKHLMLARDPIVVDRVNPREDLTRVLREGEPLLARGRSIIVFPQTTRMVYFEPERFNSIGVKLARNAGVSIVPIAVRSDAWGNGKWVKEFGRIDPSRPIHLAFGDPIRIEGRGNSAHQDALEFITEHLRQWGVPIGAAPQNPADDRSSVTGASPSVPRHS